MGEMKHTPGPWIVRPDYEDDGHVDELRGFDIVSPSGEEVVSCQGIIPGPRSREDACLIAAAPDLFEAARKMVARQPYGQPDDGPLYDEFQALRAALSKAEGRSLSSASGQEGGE